MTKTDFVVAEQTGGARLRAVAGPEAAVTLADRGRDQTVDDRPWPLPLTFAFVTVVAALLWAAIILALL